MRIALIGYGKMGHAIEEIALHRGHQIVKIIDIDNTYDFESDAFKSADVAIEFSAPECAYDNVIKAFNAGVKVVSGTTGWLAQHEEEMKQKCDNGNTLFWASNYSIGVAIFMAVNRSLAQIMNLYDNYDVEIKETHHIQKLDAPSGTALTLSDIIKSELTRVDNIKIESIREGEIAGIHTVTYDSPADRIILTHDAKNRNGFAQGAVLAAEFTAKHKGFLSINDLLNF